MIQELVTVGLRPEHSGSQLSLRLTVIFTTVPGTGAALATAGGFAQDLGLRLTLLVPQVVPYQLPITRPPVAVSHIRQMALSLISASRLNAHDVNVQIWLCRDRLECLRHCMMAQSVVFLGGRNSWWRTRERRLGRALRSMGHDVVFVGQEEQNHA